MQVDAEIIIAKAQNVLRVPNSAITEVRERKYVEVMSDGATERKRFEGGITDGAYTEVKDGLTEGVLVVTGKSKTASSTSRGASSPQGGPGFGGPVLIGPGPRP
jgi:multidrug efflux pump subunit AcrA (membrane-fusion protein)